MVVGMSSAAGGWLLGGWLGTLTTSYARLDQWTALVLGATIGAGIAGARAFRQHHPVATTAAAGAIRGGVGALAGISLLAFAHGAIGPAQFVAERLVAWMLSAVGATMLLVLLDPPRRRSAIREGIAIAAVGGATAGAIFTLPGSSDVWQAAAYLWFGGAVALAVSGPELWHAVAVLELLPTRDRRWNPLRTREWPLYDGVVLALGEAKLACADGQVALYPPAGGVVADGHTVRQPRYLDATAIVAVGRTRYRLQVRGRP